MHNIQENLSMAMYASNNFKKINTVTGSCINSLNYHPNKLFVFPNQQILKYIIKNYSIFTLYSMVNNNFHNSFKISYKPTDLWHLSCDTEHTCMTMCLKFSTVLMVKKFITFGRIIITNVPDCFSHNFLVVNNSF